MAETVTNLTSLSREEIEGIVAASIKKTDAIKQNRDAAFSRGKGFMYGLLNGSQESDRAAKQAADWFRAAASGDVVYLSREQVKYTEALKTAYNAGGINRQEFYTLAPANEGTNSAGGYNVPLPVATEISRNLGSYGFARRYFRTVAMDRRQLQIAGLATKPSVAVTAENAAISASKPVLDALTLTAKKIAAIYSATMEYIEDNNVSPDLWAFIVEIFTEQFAILEDKSAFQNAATNWNGLLWYGAGTLSASGAIAANGSIGVARSGSVTGGKTGYPQVGDTVGATDFWSDLVYVLQAQPSSLFQGAKIFVDQNVLVAALSLRSTQGLFVGNTISNLQVNAGLDGQPTLSYMGYEIVPIPSGIMFTYDASAHASAPFTAFCNPMRSWCMMGIRGGFTVEFSKDAPVDTISAFEYDLQLMRLKERVAFGVGRPETVIVLRTDAS